MEDGLPLPTDVGFQAPWDRHHRLVVLPPFSIHPVVPIAFSSLHRV